MLYSISVNLPAHRAGQLDRVIVVASPVNDINLYAWDLNRVKRFIELDIGIRMEPCHSCYRGRSMNITFILEKQFVKDCIEFLCRETQISNPPSVENGLFIYSIDHKCTYREKDEALKEDGAPPIPPRPPLKEEEAPPIPPRPPLKEEEYPPIPPRPSKHTGGASKSDDSEFHVSINNSNDVSTDDHRRSRCFTTTSVDVTFNCNQSNSFRPALPIPEQWDDYTGSESCTAGTEMESLFLADGALSKPKDSTHEQNSEFLPPRTIPRKDHETSIPAADQPYYNFQPHLFNHHGNKCFEAPYQISSRIIIKDSGEVQFERNIMGNRPPKRHGGFHFKQQIPIPPRGIRANSDLKRNSGSTGGGNPSWQSNVNFQSNAHVTDNGSQFSHEVNASVSAMVDLEAPPIPPRPHRKSSGGLSTTSSTYSQTSRTTCKSPVPLPRSNISSSNIKRSPTHFISEGDAQQLPDISSHNELLSPATDPSTDPVVHSSPYESKQEPRTLPILPHRGVTFSQLRANSDSELESQFHKYGGMSHGLKKSSSTKRASQVSDTSDVYIIPTTPLLTHSRSGSRNPLSPSYVDESQFLQPSSPYYLRLVEVNEEVNNDGETFLPDTHTEQNILEDGSSPFVYGDHAANIGDHGLVDKEESRSPPSLEHDDKECDFEDAASIAFIQSSYRQRCASSTSESIEESVMSSSAIVSIQLLEEEDLQEKLESPPRKMSKTEDTSDQQTNEASKSVSISQESLHNCFDSTSPAVLVSLSHQSLFDSQSEDMDKKEAMKFKPVPRPRSKIKLNISKSLGVLSSSDSNLLDSVNETCTESNWSIKAGQKSNSLCTRFFLDEMGIGVSEL